MKYAIGFISIVALLSGCATLTAKEKKRVDVLKCIKLLHEEDDNSGILDFYEVCRQLYGVQKIVEQKVK